MSEVFEPAATDALARLPKDVVALKIEREAMIGMALARPRDYGAVLQSLKDQLTTYKSFAEQAVYARDVGEGKLARGLSIRAAEAIAEAYKYNSITSDIQQTEDPNVVKVTATFADFQNGRVNTVSRLVSRKFSISKRKGGGEGTHDIDRFNKVVIPSAISYVIRDAILRSVPPGLRSEMEIAVDEAIDSYLDDNTVKKIVAQFSQKGIAEAQLEQLIGKPLRSWNRDDRANLLGVWNGIKSGEQTIDDVFGRVAEPKSKTGPAALKEVLKPVEPAKEVPANDPA